MFIGYHYGVTRINAFTNIGARTLIVLNGLNYTNLCILMIGQYISNMMCKYQAYNCMETNQYTGHPHNYVLYYGLST